MPIGRSRIALSQKSHTGAAPLSLGLALYIESDDSDASARLKRRTRQRAVRVGSAVATDSAAISCFFIILTLSMIFRNARVASSKPQAGTNSAVSSVV